MPEGALEKVTDFENFKKAIRLLSEADIRYYLFGGYALDILRGELTREHGDLDIYVHEDDVSNLISTFTQAGYPIIQRESMYFLESDNLEIGIVVLTEQATTLTANGNKTKAIYPKEMFAANNQGVIDGVSVSLVPNEVLKLEARFSRYESDRDFGNSIDSRDDLLHRVEVVKIRDSRGETS